MDYEVNFYYFQFELEKRFNRKVDFVYAYSINGQ